MAGRLTLLITVASLAGFLLQAARALPWRDFARAEINSPTKEHHWGVNLTTPELITALGYPAEIHHVTTEDGYILELHRIPHGMDGPSDNRPVAYLEHCLLCSSSDYVMNNPDEALAYILADAGYDVWLSNMRGNTYSRNHTDLDPEQYDFWKFSWDEMAYYDVPASIDYVLGVTGVDSLYYTGWSMGTTVFWTMMSDRPEYNQKVRAMAALAPVAYLDNAIGPITYLAQYTDELQTLFDLLGVGELFPSNELMDYLAENFCDKNSTYADICYNFIFLLCGPDADELNTDVARLAAELPNVVLNYNVPKEEFNHLDFGWALHAKEYVYDKVLEFFSNY